MPVRLNKQENKSGDPALADQGFGKVNLGTKPKHHDPIVELEEAALFFEENEFKINNKSS